MPSELRLLLYEVRFEAVGFWLVVDGYRYGERRGTYRIERPRFSVLAVSDLISELTKTDAEDIKDLMRVVRFVNGRLSGVTHGEMGCEGEADVQ